VQFLIISDIHSNWQALQAVVDDAKGTYEQVLCLGDIVGYGADPNATCEWVRLNAAVSIRGNHDRAAIGDPCVDEFSDDAHTAALWTAGQLNDENRTFLSELPQGPVVVEKFAIAHGSPRDEDEYIVFEHDAAHAAMFLPADVCFIGHTHLQGGFAIRRVKGWQVPPKGVYSLEPNTSYRINPGSVGQPRDDDPRAAYAIYDSKAKQVSFKRVEYDVALAQKRIRDAGLPPFLSYRLSIGR
jgi:predicted phosphodiesterase